MHYHGTPIGGKNIDAVEVLKGRHAIVSYEHPEQLPVVMDVCQSFVLDNGAFSEWRKTGGKVDFCGYIDWVRSIYRHPGFDWCLIPDVIDGSEEENQEMIRLWVRYGLKAKGVPVWHLHESLDWLGYLTHNFATVALGSSGQWATPGTSGWWNRMADAMGICCDDDGQPRCKLHGLRMLDPEIFTRLPLASADSTNAARNNNQINRFGMYPPPTAGQRAAVIAARIEAHNSAPSWDGVNQQRLFA